MKTLLNFYNFVQEINKSNSRNYKIEILKKYKDDEDIKYFLNFIFNPYITTGIGKKAYNRFHSDQCIDVYPKNPFSSTKEALEYLKEHNTSDDNTRNLMFSYYIDVGIYELKLKLNPQQKYKLQELFFNIITKNVILGIDTLTINKCIPNLIPTFNVQLANKYFEKPEYVEGKVFALTTKIDGGRIIALKENGQVSFYTRAGQKYEGLVDLEAEMLEKLPDNICLDGEITLLNPGKLTSKEQYKKTMKITRKDGEKHGVKMLVFDCMTAEEFRNQNCSTPYFIRRADLLTNFTKSNVDYYYHTVCKILKDKNIPDNDSQKYRDELLELINKTYTYFNILPILYQGEDTNKIIEWLNYNINRGEEGVMINIIDAPYSFKRTNNLLKVKKMNDIDLPVLDFEEGDNKYKGKLGAIITEYKGFPLNVGSGIKDKLREKIWNNKEEYRGLTMVVQYFEETTNEDGGISLRFPVFLDFRYDK